MGYSYTHGGHLCCDACPASSTVRKRPCPFGYCKAPAYCKACWEGGKREKDHTYHVENHCQERHNAYEARNAEERRRKAAGEFLRCAAVGVDDTMVRVWFRSATTERTYMMGRETYHAIPLGELATPDDYRKHGEVMEEAVRS